MLRPKNLVPAAPRPRKSTKLLGLSRASSSKVFLVTRPVWKSKLAHVPANLRRAVGHAGLTAHQQDAELTACHRRRDFADRVRDQASLQLTNNAPTIHALVPALHRREPIPIRPLASNDVFQL